MRKNPHRTALVTASLTGSTTSLTTFARDGDRQLLQAGSHGTRSPARQVGEPATETPSYRPLPVLRPSWSGGGACRPG